MVQMTNNNNEGRIFNIQRFSLHDGPGIRLTLFFRGCPLKCWWCHNPEGQSAEPSGPSELFTVEQVMKEVEKEIIFFDESGGGVTFSGGEPLLQVEFLNSLLERCKDRGIHTALDTSGYAHPDIIDVVVDKIDLFLFDIKLIDDSLHKRFTGVSNEVILKNLRKLSAEGKAVNIRFPLIQEITDTDRNVNDIINFLLNLNSIKRVDFLPFHKIAEGKYSRFGMKNKMSGVNNYPPEKINQLKEEFESYGLIVKTGG